MHAGIRIAALVAVVAAWFSVGVAWSATAAKIDKIRVANGDECPKGLTVTSEVEGGVIYFVVEIDAETVANAGEIYKGRVTCRAELRIGVEDKPTAMVPVRADLEGGKTRFEVRLSKEAANISDLQLAVSLHEVSGRPTLGGGAFIDVSLKGFLPKPKDGKDRAK